MLIKRFFGCLASLALILLLSSCGPSSQQPQIQIQRIPLDCQEFYTQYNIQSSGISPSTWNEIEKLVFVESAYYTDVGDGRVSAGILSVILNRAESGVFSKSRNIDEALREVIFAPYQFTPVSVHPDWFENGVCITESPFMRDSNGNPITYRFERIEPFRRELLRALMGYDPTGGALYFKVPEASVQWPCEQGLCDCGIVDLGGRTKFYRNAFCSTGETRVQDINYLQGICYSSQLGLITLYTPYYLGKLGVNSQGNCIIEQPNPISMDPNFCWSQNPNGTPFVDGSWIPTGNIYERSDHPSNLYFCVPK